MVRRTHRLRSLTAALLLLLSEVEAFAGNGVRLRRVVAQRGHRIGLVCSISEPSTRLRVRMPYRALQVSVARAREAKGEEVVYRRASTTPTPEELIHAVWEHTRIQSVHKALEANGGHASVAQWAMAAGYFSSESLLDALRIGRRAQEELVKSHIALVVSIAKKYVKIARSLSLDDLVQEGSLGLLSTAEDFDPSRGVPFGGFASVRVKSYILRAIANKDRLVRVPVHVHDMVAKMKHKEAELEAILGGAPTDEELGASLGMSAAKVVEYRNTLANNFVTPLYSFGDLPPSASSVLNKEEFQNDIKAVMEAYLTPNEIELLQLRFGLFDSSRGPLTHKDVGRTLARSTESIRLAVEHALSKLRRQHEVWEMLGHYTFEIGI